MWLCCLMVEHHIVEEDSCTVVCIHLLPHFPDMSTSVSYIYNRIGLGVIIIIISCNPAISREVASKISMAYDNPDKLLRTGLDGMV